MVSNNTASGLSARTGDLVQRQVKPQEQEYRLSRLSGIQVQPLTSTLTCPILSAPHFVSPSPSCNEEEAFETGIGECLSFSRKRSQPTCESHALNAAPRSVNGFAAASETPRGFAGADRLGIRGDPEKRKRRAKRNPNMITIAKVLVSPRGFNCMVRERERDRERRGVFFFSLLRYISVFIIIIIIISFSA